jgi:hypothetical protein
VLVALLVALIDGVTRTVPVATAVDEAVPVLELEELLQTDAFRRSTTRSCTVPRFVPALSTTEYPISSLTRTISATLLELDPVTGIPPVCVAAVVPLIAPLLGVPTMVGTASSVAYWVAKLVAPVAGVSEPAEAGVLTALELACVPVVPAPVVSVLVVTLPAWVLAPSAPWVAVLELGPPEQAASTIAKMSANPRIENRFIIFSLPILITHSK